MSESERLVQFTLLGQEYKFYTGATEEEMETILAMVRKLVEDGGNKGGAGVIPVNKVAVLACLNIASRYVKLKAEFEEYKKDTETRISHINKEISEIISDDSRI